MKIHFCGAADCVTGSCHLITTDTHTDTPVGVFALGQGSEYFHDKTVDNTDIAKFIIDAITKE